jgi:subtilisin-like proprotein convertase family protein
MRTRILASLAAACVLASWTTAAATGSVSWQDAVDTADVSRPGPDGRSNSGPSLCTPGTYTGVGQSPNLPIPDGSALVLGPVTFPVQSGLTIRDVVVGLQIEHSCVGDLIVTLMRVQGPDVLSVKLLDRPSYPQRLPFGCRSDLRSVEAEPVWYFGDDAAGPMAEGSSCLLDGQAIPEGCYQVAPESAWDLRVFRGLPIGGSFETPAQWYLVVRDDRAGDTGRVDGWSIHLLDQPTVSVDESSWGSVKSFYRD